MSRCDPLRENDRASIQQFLLDNSDLLGGRVLDYGCGQKPYKKIVKKAGGDYHGFDRVDFPASLADDDVDPDSPGPFDAIISTQVIQYVPASSVQGWLYMLRSNLRPGGWLLLTGPTNWVVNEPGDLHRYTRNGISRLLKEVGFSAVMADVRGEVKVGRDHWQIGFWAKGRA